jgi:hypothetical protein
VANPDGGTANLFAVHALSADDVWTISIDGMVTDHAPPGAGLPGDR